MIQSNLPGPPIRSLLILGDSISHNGTYANLIELFLRRQGESPVITNVSLSSETTSGLSEPTHPMCPRPCIHTRVDAVLRTVDADTVLIFYGINDGIYHPFRQDIFNAYQEGIRKLIRLLRGQNKRVIVLTPPYHDKASAASVGTPLKPAGLPSEVYAYNAAYEDYDSVLEVFATWLMTIPQEFPGAVAVDVHTPLKQYFSQKRQISPTFTEGDGIHPQLAGHAVIANAILSAVWNQRLPHNFTECYEKEPLGRLIANKNGMLSRAYRAHCGFYAPFVQEAALPLKDALEKAADMETEITLLAAVEANQ